MESGGIPAAAVLQEVQAEHVQTFSHTTEREYQEVAARGTGQQGINCAVPDSATTAVKEYQAHLLLEVSTWWPCQRRTSNSKAQRTDSDRHRNPQVCSA